MRVWHGATSALLTLMLAGCGGGGEETGGIGGGGGGGPAPVPGGSGTLSSFFVSDWSVFQTAAANLRNSAEYQLQFKRWFYDENRNGRVDPLEDTFESFPLVSSRIDYAHAAGLTGKDQVIAIVDYDFLSTHEAIAGRVIAGGGGTTEDDHGTAVASVAAGDSATMTGVAPEARLVLGRYTSTATMAAATRLAITEGAVAQNNSWGYALPVTTNSLNTVFSGTNGQAYLQALDDYAAQGVVVFAASNTGTGATIMEALPALRSTLEAGWLAVVSAVPTFNDTRILSADLQSAPCAEAARWCLVADGSWTAATVNFADLGDTNDYAFTIGTSFATPMVTGAMALLAEAFPDLTPHQLRVRLLASADDGFFTADQSVELAEGFVKGYSSTWGHGFLDLRAALSPIGQTRMALDSGATVTTDQPLIATGGGYGDAVSRALAMHKVLVTDDLGGDFSMPGDALVARSAARAVAPKLMAAALSGTGGASDLLSSYAAPRLNLGLGDGDMRLSVMGTPGRGADAEFGLSLARAFDLGAARLDLGLSVARDQGTLAGLTADGSDLVSLDLGLTAPLGDDGFLRLSGQMGLAQPRGTGAFADVTSSRFDSLSLDIGRTDAFRSGDRLSLSLALPVAMTSGRAALNLPMARADGSMRFDRVAFDLAPEARQMDLSVSYDMPVGRNATLTLGATHAMNHGHVAGARDTGGILALRIRF